MTKRTKRILLVILTILLLIGLLLAINTWIYLSNVILPWNKDEAIEATIAMGGLAKLPEGARDISVKKERGLFTRTYRLSFYSTEDQIKKWIEESKRLKDNPPEKTENNTYIFMIRPGEEIGPKNHAANGGWVEIDWESGKVFIYMAWS